MRLTALILLTVLAACRREPNLEARTFTLRYLNPETAMPIIRPYNIDGDIMFSPTGVLTVRATRASLDRIAQVLAEHDKPAANIRLVFQVIRANGAGPRDSSIAAVETELRRLFRFAGYRLVAEGMTTVGPDAPCRVRMDGQGGPYHIVGDVGQITVVGDSGVAHIRFALEGPRGGNILQSELTLGLGRTVVLGGQLGTEPGAVILAVRTERVN